MPRPHPLRWVGRGCGLGTRLCLLLILTNDYGVHDIEFAAMEHSENSSTILYDILEPFEWPTHTEIIVRQLEYIV